MTDLQVADFKVSKLILSSICTKDDLCRRIIPYLKPEYFESQSEKTVFELAKEYMDKYHAVPPRSAMQIALESRRDLLEDTFSTSIELIDEVYGDVFQIELGKTTNEWVLAQTETFIQDRAVYLGITRSLKIIDGEDKTLTKGAIPKILQDAISATLDPSIGHDYLEDADLRFDFYHTKEKRVKTRLAWINQITKGGFPRKTVTVFVAGTNVGKSLAMCSLASDAILDGYKVLYITAEMAEIPIAQRIDMNLLDITSDDLQLLSKEKYQEKVQKVRTKAAGKIIIKEYPTASANTNHFRALLGELRTKKNFVPDIIFVDYLNICASSRLKSSEDMYSYVKATAEELRGLAGEFDVPIVTATQTNRDGQGKADFDFAQVSESHGTSMTVDLLIAMIQTEQLEQMGQFRFKQIKNRLAPLEPRSALIGVDKMKMRLFDSESDAQPKVKSFRLPTKTEFDKAVEGLAKTEKFAGFKY